MKCDLAIAAVLVICAVVILGGVASTVSLDIDELKSKIELRR